MEIINYNIKFIRNYHKLTQAEFADRLKTTRDSISKYEGKIIPRPDFLRLLSREFNVNLHSLFITKMTKNTYEHFLLNQDSVTGSLNFQSDDKEFDKITAKDIKMFDALIKEKIDHLRDKDLNENDRKIILDKLQKYQSILINKLIEFYDKQSQLFDYLSEKGILPNK